MAKMQKYNSRATVRARKVTDKAGERVVTTNGPVDVAYGDYVVEEAGATRVQDAASFEAAYAKPSGSKSHTTSATDPDAPPTVAGTDEKGQTDPAATAKARVAAARAAKKAGGR